MKWDVMTALCEWTDRGGERDRPAWQTWFLNRLITLVYWTTNKEPWQYYFGAPKAGYLGRVDWHYIGPWWKTYCVTVWCRLRHHPAGQVFFSSGGLEPDESCRNCGEGC
jgi:hypothetical protein